MGGDRGADHEVEEGRAEAVAVVRGMPSERSRAALAELAGGLLASGVLDDDDPLDPPLDPALGHLPDDDPPDHLPDDRIDESCAADQGARLLGEIVDVVVGARRLAAWALWLQLAAVAHVVSRWQASPPIIDGALPEAGHDDLAGGALARRLRRLVDEIDVWGPLDTRDLAEEFVAAEISAAAGLSHYGARQVVDAARTLFTTDRLPRTRHLLRAGLLDWTKLRTILTATQTLDDHVCALVEAYVVPDADLVVTDPLDTLADPSRPGRDLPAVARMTNPALAAALAAAIAAVDAEAAARRARAARRERRVSATPTADSMGRFELTTGHEEIAAVLAGLDDAVAAAKHHGDERTADQIRADHAVHLLTNGTHGRDAYPAGHDGSPSRPHGASGRRGLQIRLTMPLSTWLDVADDPAVLDGYGPIPAAIARQIAAEAARDHPTTTTWRCVPVDDRHGTVLGVGDVVPTPRYAPTQRQRTFVRTAEAFCVFPGCRARSWRCEIDHRRAYDHDAPDRGGPTCTCNLEPLCGRHHRLKTAGLVAPRAVEPEPPHDPDAPVLAGEIWGEEPPGTIEWTTWTGRRHLHRPPRATPEPADPDVVAACAGLSAPEPADATDDEELAALAHWDRARRRLQDRDAARQQRRGARSLSAWEAVDPGAPPPF